MSDDDWEQEIEQFEQEKERQIEEAKNILQKAERKQEEISHERERDIKMRAAQNEIDSLRKINTSLTPTQSQILSSMCSRINELDQLQQEPGLHKLECKLKPTDMAGHVQRGKDLAELVVNNVPMCFMGRFLTNFMERISPLVAQSQKDDLLDNLEACLTIGNAQIVVEKGFTGVPLENNNFGTNINDDEQAF